MSLRNSLKAMLLAASALACLGGSCAVGEEPYFSAHTTDGRVDFLLSQETARSAFASVCEGRPDVRCDAFERYRMTVAFDDELFGLTFIHEDAENAPAGIQLSILCSYPPRGRHCGPGGHRD